MLLSPFSPEMFTGGNKITTFKAIPIWFDYSPLESLGTGYYEVIYYFLNELEFIHIFTQQYCAHDHHKTSFVAIGIQL